MSVALLDSGSCVCALVCVRSEGSLHAIWHKFFQKILNSGEKSATSVLTELHEDLRDYIENVVGFYKITSNII